MANVTTDKNSKNTKYLPIAEFAEPPNCSCATCKGMCQTPCWPTPDEFVDLLRRGYADRMMTSGRPHPSGQKDKYITVICPAKQGLEKWADQRDKDDDRCTFQTDAGLCELHGACKPLEGRLAHCDDEEEAHLPTDVREEIAKLWTSRRAQALVRGWIENHATRGNEWEFFSDGVVLEPLD